jgi:hypothetical protein
MRGRCTCSDGSRYSKGSWRASTLLTESLRLRQGGAIDAILESLEGLAGLAVAEERSHAGGSADALRAVRRLGAAEATRDVLGLPIPPGDRAAYERDVAAVRDLLDAAARETAWAAGRAMTLEQAIAYALGEDEQGRALSGQEQMANPTWGA